MKALAILGLVLILLGGIVMAYDGIPYSTDQNVVRVGPYEARIKEEKKVSVPAALGGVGFGAGLVMVLIAVFNRKKS